MPRRSMPMARFAVLLCAAGALWIQGCRGKAAERGGAETRVPVKTSLPVGADPAAGRVLTFAEFTAIPEPPGVSKKDPRYESARIPAFPNSLGVQEGDVVRLRGWLWAVTLMGDGDLNIRLTGSAASPNRYAVGEIPDDDDVSDSRLGSMVRAARAALKADALSGHAPSRAGTILAAPIYVEVSGQLYFNDTHVGDARKPDKQGTTRATDWQIHPVLSFAPVPIAPPSD
ncbi:MAG: hypothetical protein WBE09_04505 [Candidatus Acidiferrales bacterium]